MSQLTVKCKITISAFNEAVVVSPEAIEEYIKEACMVGGIGFARAMWNLGIWEDLEVTKVQVNE